VAYAFLTDHFEVFPAPEPLTHLVA